jgi:hypothetical protein
VSDVKGKGKAVSTSLNGESTLANMTKEQLEVEVKELQGLLEELSLKVGWEVLRGFTSDEPKINRLKSLKPRPKQPKDLRQTLSHGSWTVTSTAQQPLMFPCRR